MFDNFKTFFDHARPSKIHVSQIHGKVPVIVAGDVWRGACALRVTMDAEGDLQFLGEQPLREDDVAVIALEQMLAKDADLKNLPPFALGESYICTASGSKWVLDQ